MESDILTAPQVDVFYSSRPYEKRLPKLPLWPYPTLEKPLLHHRKPVRSFRPFSFEPFCWDCRLTLEISVMKSYVTWRLIQYNPPLERTWSKKSFTYAGEFWMQCSVVLQQPPSLLCSTPHIPWGEDTIWHARKTLGQLSSLFSPRPPLACLSPKHLPQIYKLQARPKGELRTFPPFPGSLCLQSTGGMIVQGKKANNCNVTGYHDLPCFIACSLLSKALCTKLGLPDKVVLLCSSARTFWIVAKKRDIGLLRSSVPANQSHVPPFFFPPQELMD